jgi:hypothetical protein
LPQNTQQENQQAGGLTDSKPQRAPGGDSSKRAIRKARLSRASSP